MNAEAWIHDELEKLRAASLERHLEVRPLPGGVFCLGEERRLNFSSNDYLGLARHPRLIEAAAAATRRTGAGAGASRLVTGTLAEHVELEAAVARHKGYPAALVFGSGFLTSVGVIPALVGRGDHVFSDRLIHASMIDGIRLSRATLHRYRHNDLDHLARLLTECPASGRRLIVTESVFSMDGDRAPLPALAELAQRHGALLMVDEAHATGVLGPAGAGLVAEHGLQDAVNLCMGTFSKALGSYGGYVACSEAMRAWLINRARAFIYTTALPPGVVAASREALDLLGEEPDLGPRLQVLAGRLRRQLNAAGLETAGSTTQIVPLVVGEAVSALAVAQRLRGAGILTVAIRPPTVPDGTARVRLAVTLAHDAADIDRLAGACVAATRAEGLS
jgi:8-amino-7-oxononanoate synthase